MVNLRESHKSSVQNRNQQRLSIGDIVVIHEDKLPRTQWCLSIIEQLHHNREATVTTQRFRLIRPVNLLYPIEYVNMKNKEPQKEHLQNKRPQNERPRRDTAIRGELMRKFCGSG